MKVVLLNGSSHEKGNTAAALGEIARTLEACGVETELAQLGKHPYRGCIGCGGCAGKGHCVFDDDEANRLIDAIDAADGLIVGSPVYYAAANGALTALLDRVFYAGSGKFAHKPAAAVAVARRGGATATLDQLNKYFTISQMPVVPSTYWNMVHGMLPGEALQDAEGLQTMRNLAQNMAWMLRCIEAGRAAGIEPPQAERGSRTNFVR